MWLLVAEWGSGYLRERELMKSCMYYWKISGGMMSCVRSRSGKRSLAMSR